MESLGDDERARNFADRYFQRREEMTPSSVPVTVLINDADCGQLQKVNTVILIFLRTFT